MPAATGLYYYFGYIRNLETWDPPVTFDPEFPPNSAGVDIPDTLIYDKVKNRVYLTSFNNDTGVKSVHWIELTPPVTVRHKLSSFVSNAYQGVWLDASTSRLFVVGDGIIEIVDTNTMTLQPTSWSIPGLAGVIGLDEVHRRLWVNTAVGTPFVFSMVLLDLDTGAVVATQPRPDSLSTLAQVYFSTSTNKAFIYGPTIDGGDVNAVNVIDGIQIYDALDGHFINTVGTVGTLPNGWAIADPRSNGVYSPAGYSPAKSRFYTMGVQKTDATHNFMGLIEFNDATETFDALPLNWNAYGAPPPDSTIAGFGSGPVIDEVTGTIYIGGASRYLAPDSTVSLADSRRIFRVVTPATPFSTSTWVDHVELAADGVQAVGFVLLQFAVVTPPPAPTAIVTSDTSVTVSWSGTPVAGSPNASYVIKDNLGDIQTVSAPTTSVTFTGLITGATYTFTVTVTDTTAGVTAPSLPSNEATPRGTIDSSTTAIYAADGSSVIVCAKNNGVFAGYNVELDPAKPYTFPSAVIYDANHNRVYVFGNDEAHWYDANTQAHDSTIIGVTPQAIGQQFIAYDPTGNKVFFATAALGGGVPVFDTITNTITTTLATGGDSCAYIYADEVHRRLWAICTTNVAGPNHSKVYIFDLDTLTLVSTLIDYPDPAVAGWCRDPLNPRVFTLQAEVFNPGGPASGGIDIRSALDGSITGSFPVSVYDFIYTVSGPAVLVPSGASLLAYSSTYNRIYALGYAYDDFFPVVFTIDADTHSIGYVVNFPDTCLRVEEATGTLYTCLAGSSTVFRSYDSTITRKSQTQ